MDRRSQIEAAIAAQEQLRSVVGDEVVAAAIAALRGQLDDTTMAAPQRKLATVLFADIAGFTSWGETADAEAVGDAMDALWQRLDRIVADHNGRVDKHIGDALMAVWGAPSASEDDPEYAIRAALAMREAFAVESLGDLDEVGLRLRIGINTGPVILRMLGTTGEYTALGDAVNVAARLEAAAPPGEILVGHDTYRHVRGVFSATERPPLEVKGKREPLRTYLVTGLRPRAFRLENRGVEGLETRMIGRADELDELRRSLADAVTSQTPRFLQVVGDAGVGKSRLLYEFLDWLQLQPDEVYLLQGRADAQKEMTPYSLFKDLLYFRFEIALDDPVADALAKLVRGFGTFGGLNEEAAHRAAHLIGFDMGSSPHVSAILGYPEELRDDGELAIRRLVGGMAREWPVVMLLEDLHWADRASLALAEQIATQTAGPLLLVATARRALFEKSPDWGGAGDRIELTPLSPEVSRDQVRDVLRKAADVADEFVESIVEAAAGNPFYVEELVKSLIEAGKIEVTADRWAIAPDAAAAVSTPPTLVALLQARLDRLSPEERAILQPASVVGQVFWDDAVDAAAGRAAADDDFGDLTRRELIVRRPDSAFSGTTEYGFKHALLHDVVYETVLRADRRTYHRAVADWLVARADNEAWTAVIASHYAAAEAAAAAEWFVRAGIQARSRFANEEALAAFTRALALGNLDEESRFAALDASGEVLMLSARYEEAAAAHREMLDAARESGNLRAQARALTGILFATARTSSTVDLAGVATEAVETVRAMPEPDLQLLCEALRGAGWNALRSGALDYARSSAEEAAVAARTVGDRRGLSLSLNLLSLVESASGNFLAAEEHMDQALEIDRELGNRRDECTSLLNLGESARLRGDYERAVDRFEEALDIARQIGDRDSEALALSNLGGALVGLRRYEAALDSLATALATFEATGRREYLSETRRFFAEAYLGLGDAAAAEDWASGALADGTVAGNPEQVGHAWRVLGLTAAALGRPVVADGAPVGADQCFTLSVEEFAGTDVDRAMALADWARSKASTDPARARELWDEARGILAPRGLGELLGTLQERPRPQSPRREG